MKKLVVVVLNLAFVLGGSSAFAGSSASQDLSLLQKFQDSSAVAKGILKRHCKRMPEISELCKGELSGADLSEVKETVVSNLEKEVASEPAMQSQATSVNVSQGSNSSQQVSTSAAYPGAACVEQVMANITKTTSSLNERMAAKNAARNLARAAK